MRISSTGFARIDLLHLTRLVRHMGTYLCLLPILEADYFSLGASYDEVLTPKASVLICMDPRSASHEKLRYTREWGVPVVSADWLWISVQAGQKKPFEPYIVQSPLPAGNGILGKQQDNYSKRERPRYVEKNGGSVRPETKDANVPPSRVEEKEAYPSGGKANTANKYIEPVDGDGFRKAKHNPSRKTNPSLPPKTLSPTKEQSKSLADAADGASASRPESSHSASSEAPSTLGIALSGFLKQARAAKGRSLAESEEKNNNSSRRRRLPLKGRANSTNEQALFSRASSIDTLNDDGTGSAIESVNTDGSHALTTNAITGNRPSLLSGGRLDFADESPLYRQFEDEDDAPAMTQLGYEDPDAVAARRELLQSAGRISNDNPTEKNQGVDEMKDLENGGWRTGRRTRRATKVMDD